MPLPRHELLLRSMMEVGIYRRHREHGQALIYGLFLLITGLVGLFFLFNTGQLASEKTRLVNTADAVAYSAAVLHARALNFDAYNNRALIANEVLIAQLVSVSSWAQYAKQHVDNIPAVFPECMVPNGAGAVAGAVNNYGADYAAMCYLIAQPELPVREAIDALGVIVPQVSAAAVTAIELNKSAIKAAQEFLHTDLVFKQNRQTLLQNVADRNYVGAGSVTVVSGGLTGGGAGTGLVDDWSGFTQKYSGDERTRLGEVTAIAAEKSEFLNKRTWESKSTFPVGNVWCLGHRNLVTRAGGTNLIGLDEWKAEDTESFWSWHPHGFLKHCRKKETPIAWGEQRAFPEGSEQDASNAWLGNSRTVNPTAHSFASSAEWTNYSGLPAYYDLSTARLTDSTDPRLVFSVKVVRNANATATSSGTSGIRPSDRLNHFPSPLAGGVMSAISTGEVYFERPWFNEGNYSYTTGDMAYIVIQNQSVPTGADVPKMRELGSLFNPYWQVHLTSNPAASVTAQQTAQGGAKMP